VSSGSPAAEGGWAEVRAALWGIGDETKTKGRELKGMLHKRGYWNPAWKARYFVLTPSGNLEYYKASDGTPNGEPNGVIPVALRAGCRGEAEETLVRSGGRDGRLEVIELTVRMPGSARGRTYILGAATGAEHDRWIVALQDVAGAWRGDMVRRESSGSAGSREAALSRKPSASPSQSQIWTPESPSNASVGLDRAWTTAACALPAEEVSSATSGLPASNTLRCSIRCYLVSIHTRLFPPVSFSP
jgi:hypothetical protein